jgi:hypothetical protein
MRDDHELMKLEGAEAISQLKELSNLIKEFIPIHIGKKTLVKR